MKQTRRSSAIEAASNAAAGFVLATAINYFLLPLWGFHPRLIDSVVMTSLFVVGSIAKSFVIRRLFEHLRHTGTLP